MRVPLEWMLFFSVVVEACGGNLSTAPGGFRDGAGGAGNGADAAQGEEGPPHPTAGPIDANGAPTIFAMACGGSPSEIAFKLPCAVGGNPINVTECYALGDDPGRLPVLTFMVPLAYMADHLNEPIQIDDFPAPPNGKPLTVGGVDYAPTRVGKLTVTQVDTVSRAFVGQMQLVEFGAISEGGPPTVCSAHDATLWALPGGFY